MNKDQKEYIDKYIKENQIEDTTQQIRDLLQSVQLTQEVRIIQDMRQKHNHSTVKKMCDKKCVFLTKSHPKLYEKLLSEDYSTYTESLNITHEIIKLLQDIECGRTNQNEGAYQFGLLCKRIYIDPKLSTDQNTDEPVRNISWNAYKCQILSQQAS